MSRSTQYIGLNQRAWDFLEKNNYKRLADYVGDEGMFDESLYYGIYQVTIEYEDHSFSFPDENGNETNVFINKRIETYAEITQCSPWSSGPMYFTCLKNIITGEIIEEWTEGEINNY